MTDMIDRIEWVLKKLHILSPFSKDDVLNASSEDAMRAYETAVDEVRHETRKRVRGNEHLRNILRAAREKTHSFADFEDLVRHRGDDRD